MVTKKLLKVKDVERLTNTSAVPAVLSPACCCAPHDILPCLDYGIESCLDPVIG
jgi:hypothetical protein